MAQWAGREGVVGAGWALTVRCALGLQAQRPTVGPALVHCRIPSIRRRSQSPHPPKVRQNGSFYFVSRARQPVCLCTALTCRVASAEVSLRSVKHVGRDGWSDVGGGDGAVDGCRGAEDQGWDRAGLGLDERRSLSPAVAITAKIARPGRANLGRRLRETQR